MTPPDSWTLLLRIGYGVLTNPIDAEHLAHLGALCTKAADAYRAGNPTEAAEVMTPTAGFFFGSTDADEYWLEDMVLTTAQIERVIRAAIEVGGITFTYRSSW